MSVRRYHGESSNVHTSANIYVQRNLTDSTYEVLAVVDVGQYNRLTLALFNLSGDNALEFQLFANLLKNPDTTDFSQANGWFVTDNISWQGLYRSNSYDHDRKIAINTNKVSIYHNFLYGIQYIAIRARPVVRNTSGTILVTGHAAG